MIWSLVTLTCQKLSIAKCWKTENSTEFAGVSMVSSSWMFEKSHRLAIFRWNSQVFPKKTSTGTTASHLCRAHAATDLETSPDFYREITWKSEICWIFIR